MDAGYALAVETYIRLGMDLLSATAKVNETLGLKTDPAPNLPTPIDNAKALAALQAAVGGIR
jgi:hypothetical protein